LTDQYDILIVGSGLGGLVSANILSRKGYRIAVFEKNNTIGGTLQNFKFSDCTFSTGMHYLGSLDDGQVLYKLFRYLKIFDGLKVKRMDEHGFDRFRIGTKEYAYPMSWAWFKEKMSAYYPAETEAISKYVSLMKDIAGSQDIYNLRLPVNGDIRTNPYLKTGIYPAIRKITSNKNLQNALCALNFVYAGDKKTSPLYTHALINNYYVQSAYKFVGGSGQIAGLLSQNIQEQGGEIHTNTEVTRYVFDDDKLSGVKLKDGTVIHGERIISNVHPAKTMEMIPEGRIRKSFRSRLTTIPYTISVFGLHLKLKPKTFPSMNYNYHWYKNDDVWAVSSYNPGSWPGYYFLYTPATTHDDCYTNCVSIYAYMKYEEVKQWEAWPSGRRGTVYKEWKQKKAEKLIALAARSFPSLKGNVVEWTATTPLTYRNYIGTPGGAMYGTLRDYHNPMASYVFPRTKLPNLFFTGQNINLHGMLGVSISALLTCGEIVGLETLIKEINEA